MNQEISDFEFQVLHGFTILENTDIIYIDMYTFTYKHIQRGMVWRIEAPGKSPQFRVTSHLIACESNVVGPSPEIWTFDSGRVWFMDVYGLDVHALEHA